MDKRHVTAADFPAGQPMVHAPAPGHSCIFVIDFDGPVDVEPLND